MSALAEIRKSKGLTQKRLGEILNVSSQAIANYECGKRKNQLEFAQKYAHALNITLDEFARLLKNSTS